MFIQGKQGTTIIFSGTEHRFSWRDTENMRILRHTEQIVVPERGARLGNFGVTQINDNKAIITAAEWMQPKGCEKYGSDNSVFITTVEQ